MRGKWWLAWGAFFGFAGGLYTYVLTGDRVWAMIVPLGGVLLLAGWGVLVIGCLRLKSPDKEAPERHAPDGRF